MTIGKAILAGNNALPTFDGDTSGNELLDGDGKFVIGITLDGVNINLNLSHEWTGVQAPA